MCKADSRISQGFFKNPFRIPEIFSRFEFDYFLLITILKNLKESLHSFNREYVENQISSLCNLKKLKMVSQNDKESEIVFL